jgi:DNA-binding XRE family transcriptional regulator
LLTLRALRERHGLTQGQLAERLGVTHHTIRAWEKGERAVRKDWRFKLAIALGCSVRDLRKGEGVARSKRWRRALANLSDAAPVARLAQAKETWPGPQRRTGFPKQNRKKRADGTSRSLT